MTCVNLWLVGAVLAATGLVAQETPHPNRLPWLSIFPEPLPDGVNQLSVEASNQFLRTSRQNSPDGLAHAELEGEDWQLTSDVATALGPGLLNLRTRLTYRSEGIMDRVIMNWHDLLGVGQGGRNGIRPAIGPEKRRRQMDAADHRALPESPSRDSD